jgi:hypothetical protein
MYEIYKNYLNKVAEHIMSLWVDRRPLNLFIDFISDLRSIDKLHDLF